MRQMRAMQVQLATMMDLARHHGWGTQADRSDELPPPPSDVAAAAATLPVGAAVSGFDQKSGVRLHSQTWSTATRGLQRSSLETLAPAMMPSNVDNHACSAAEQDGAAVTANVAEDSDRRMVVPTLSPALASWDSYASESVLEEREQQIASTTPPRLAGSVAYISALAASCSHIWMEERSVLA
eukprot:SAG11_NODE_3798_length_2218_cov_1.281265_1_plen_182_part_10